MDIVAIAEITWAGLGALLTGSAAVIAALSSLKRAKADQRVEDEEDCNDRLLDMVERHQLWADKEATAVRRAAERRSE